MRNILLSLSLLLLPAFASEDDAIGRLEAFKSDAREMFPSYFFGDKDLSYSLYLTSDDLVTFETTLFAGVNYVILAASDNNRENIDIEGQYGFEYDGGESSKKNLFPFYISFIKRNQYAFSVPVTGSYKLLFRMSKRAANQQDASTGWVAWMLGYEVKGGKKK